MIDRVVRDQFHFFYIGLAIFGEILLVHEDIHNLGDNVVTLQGLVYLGHDPTLQGHREIREHWSVHVLGLLG